MRQKPEFEPKTTTRRHRRTPGRSLPLFFFTGRLRFSKRTQQRHCSDPRLGFPSSYTIKHIRASATQPVVAHATVVGSELGVPDEGPVFRCFLGGHALEDSSPALPLILRWKETAARTTYAGCKGREQKKYAHCGRSAVCVTSGLLSLGALRGRRALCAQRLPCAARPEPRGVLPRRARRPSTSA